MFKKKWQKDYQRAHFIKDKFVDYEVYKKFHNKLSIR